MSKSRTSPLMRGEKELTQMKYKDLKIGCIVRGMLFEDIVEGSYTTLSRYFLDHYDDKQDKSLLEQFDTWMERTLIAKGHAKDSPLVQFRLSTTLDEDDNSKIIGKNLKKAQVKKEKKPKRERDPDSNIFKGTKKALTFELSKKGIPINDIIKAVCEKFPEAQEKSIKIWAKRALK